MFYLTLLQKAFLRSNDEKKHEQQEYARNELHKQQPKQIDVIPITFDEDNTRHFRNNVHDASLEKEDDELEQQDKRQMLWLRKYILCVESDRNKWETITTRSRLVRAYYRGRGAVPGVCGDQCDTVCDHKACFADTIVSVGGILCNCLEDAKPLCGANSKCTITSKEQEVCTCKDGYTGNATAGCTDLNECSTNICFAEQHPRLLVRTQKVRITVFVKVGLSTIKRSTGLAVSTSTNARREQIHVDLTQNALIMLLVFHAPVTRGTRVTHQLRQALWSRTY